MLASREAEGVRREGVPAAGAAAALGGGRGRERELTSEFDCGDPSLTVPSRARPRTPIPGRLPAGPAGVPGSPSEWVLRAPIGPLVAIDVPVTIEVGVAIEVGAASGPLVAIVVLVAIDVGVALGVDASPALRWPPGTVTTPVSPAAGTTRLQAPNGLGGR
eukprot:9470042-Pyramimonas_sp.AAC.1